MVVAQAYRIDATSSGLTFVFQANQKVPKKLCEEQKAWLQGLAEKLAGRPVPVSIVVADAGMEAAPPPPPVAAAPKPASAAAANAALADPTVQAVLEIFPVEKTTVEEI